MPRTIAGTCFLAMNSIAITLLLAAALHAPHALHTELIDDTGTVYSRGYPTSATLEDVSRSWERGYGSVYQIAEINSRHPSFGWRLPDGVGEQRGYRVLVATSPELLEEGRADVWDSGEVESSATSGVECGGDGLSTGTIYHWTVRITDDRGSVSGYAPARSFMTPREWEDGFSRRPIRKTMQESAVSQRNESGNLFVDFGKSAFGQLSLTVDSPCADTLVVHLGEARDGNGVNRNPGASIRYTRYSLPVRKGRDTYALAIRPDGRNAMIKPAGTDVRPVLMPEYIGEVYPFRYCEIECGESEVGDVRRAMVHYPWKQDASYFHSSDSVLNAVWDLCRYSILSTTYAGVYVDGDRERIPYEADALINQLGHYCVDDEYTMGRYTADYLFDNATWPTEWILQAAILAWNDYLYTGDKSLLRKNYGTLKARALTDLTEDNGLISTRTGRQTPELLRNCGYYGKEIRDIVDWPQSGALGVGKEEPGEADGYEFKDFNTVVNAFHYRALTLLGRIASALGETDDEEFFEKRSQDVCEAVNRLLLDRDRGCYRDGIGSEHCSLHASMFPMAFGMVPDKYRGMVLEHMRSRGMACSVYGAQFLLDALYEGGMDGYALELLTSKGERGWWNMMEQGSTMTLEAWGRQFKPNLDWNHAWGAAPANVIPRKLMGIEPLEPGWKRMRVKPCPGNLESAEIKVPTIAGAVYCSFVQSSGRFDMSVTVPGGISAELSLPAPSRKSRMTVNGRRVKSQWRDGRVITELPSGIYQVSVIYP